MAARIVIFQSGSTRGTALDAQISTRVATGLSGRYARALFDLASEAKALPAVEASLARLKQALAASADLRDLIGNPLVGRGAAGAAAAAVAAQLEVDDLTRRFVGVLAANRRLALLPAVIRDVAALAAARRGEVTAQVTAAHPLSDAQRSALAARLKAGIGRDVALDVSIDPAIMGGLVVRVGSRMIDSSIRTRLDMLGQALKA
jgi:F-type H+-transporting ATPase subunit delta